MELPAIRGAPLQCLYSTTILGITKLSGTITWFTDWVRGHVINKKQTGSPDPIGKKDIVNYIACRLVASYT